MRKLPVIIAAAGALCVFPALAGQAKAGSPHTSGRMNHEMGSMKGGKTYGKTYGYEREGEMRHRGDREEGGRRYSRYAEGMREGCKYITVKERRGDEIVVRHFRRCD